MQQTMPPFGQLLLMYRRRMGLSQQQLGVMAGGHLYAGDISKIERGLKDPPPGPVILKWVTGLHLSHSEARQFIEAAGYSPDLLLEQAPFFSSRPYPAVLESIVDKRLHGARGFWPVWETDRSGKITKVNLLTYRIMGGLENIGDPIKPRTLLGKHIFEVYAHNLSKISAPRHFHDFWFTTIAVWKKLRGQVPTQIIHTFETAINSQPVLSLILQYGTVNIEREWEFYLSISPSEAGAAFDEPVAALEFHVEVERVDTDDRREHVGFLFTCQPLMPYTIHRIAGEYKRLIDIYGKEAFVQQEHDTHLLEEQERYPSFWPAFHLNKLFEIIFENSEFLKLYGVEESEGRVFLDRHLFEMLLDPATTNRMKGIHRQVLLALITQFISRTKDLALRKDAQGEALYEQYTRIMSGLKDQPAFAELWSSVSLSDVLTQHNGQLPSFHVESACPFASIMLSFDVVIRELSEIYEDHRVTFIPSTNATKAALLLLRLRSLKLVHGASTSSTEDEADQEKRKAHEQKQLLVLYTALKAVRVGLTKKQGDGNWKLEDEFRQLYADEAKLAAKGAEAFTDIKAKSKEVLLQFLLDDPERQDAMIAILIEFTKPLSYAHTFLLHEVNPKQTHTEAVVA